MILAEENHASLRESLMVREMDFRLDECEVALSRLVGSCHARLIDGRAKRAACGAAGSFESVFVARQR
jgi:hypothetical protein